MDLPFKAEYAKNGQASCRGCKLKIDKDSLRIAAMVQSSLFDGKTPHWYHHHCIFIKQGPKTVDDIAHFESLRWDDQQQIRAKVSMYLEAGALIDIARKTGRKRNAPGKVRSGQFFRAIKQEYVPDKKPKLEDETDGVDDKLEKRMRIQNKVMFTYRDKLKELSTKELQLLLGHNKQQIPDGEGKMLDRLSDMMAFGALQPCTECKSGQFVCDKLGYMCRGNLTEWTRCNVIVTEPKRYPFLVPDKLADKYTFLGTYEYVPRIRIFQEASSSVVENDEDDKYVSLISSGSTFASKPRKRKLKLKLNDGGAVDPDSGLNNRAHIYQKGNEKFSVVLGITDIQLKRNSYYKLQLLQSDSGNQYWLFRSWGRIGTTIGSKKLENMDLDAAQQKFMRLYEEQSGNSWHNRDNFVKMPSKLYPIDVDYGDQEDELQLNSESDVGSKLSKPVQELMKLIFDVKSMKNVMSEFELDTTKMPLGKLSKSQLQNANGVLSELQTLVESKGSRARFIDASNRFYTYVPHSFGLADPPIIDNIEMINQKICMVENLMELEIACGLIKSTGGKNTIDAYYGMLKTEIDILDREVEEFKIIQEYVKNTHATTHGYYKLEIEEVFVVKRQGEENRFKPFRELHNRKLLWHGSRVANYAGILSQGLCIAPPEAPVSGYMFGKGIYFADMVSKSANYCFTTPGRNTGLLLLCEVALGEMHELNNAKDVKKLPKGKHSVKGVGRTEPDPKHIKEISGGVHVPIGKGVNKKRPKASSLLYNEYIVYDVAQVNIKYLVQMKFKYDY